MISLLRADWRKLSHRWMPRVLTIIMLALIALIFLSVSGRARYRSELVNPDGLVFALSLAAAFAAFIWGILAGNWSGSEYSWGTIRLVLTRKPSRAEFTLSGYVTILLTVAFALVIVVLLGAIGGWIVGAATNTTVAPAATSDDPTVVVIKMFLA